MSLRIGGRSESHRLLVLPTPGRQHRPRFVKRLAQANHVSVPKDGEDPAEQLLLAAVRDDFLRREMLHERLSHRQPSVLMRFRRQGHVLLAAACPEIPIGEAQQPPALNSKPATVGLQALALRCYLPHPLASSRTASLREKRTFIHRIAIACSAVIELAMMIGHAAIT